MVNIQPTTTPSYPLSLTLLSISPYSSICNNFPEKKMAKNSILNFLLLILIIAPIFIQGSRSPRGTNSFHHLSQEQIDESKKSSKRVMIGSVAPTCTYNECRGCKYRCRAEQVPVEGNDPIHSAYHYKCVCHR